MPHNPIMVLGYGAFSAVDTNGDALAGGEYEIIAVNAFYKLRIDQVAAVASEQRIPTCCSSDVMDVLDGMERPGR